MKDEPSTARCGVDIFSQALKPDSPRLKVSNSINAGFRIVQGTGAEQTMTGVYPGEPVTVIEEFPRLDRRGRRRDPLGDRLLRRRGTGGETVSVTGVLEKPDATTYMYGTHALTDKETGERYALASESVDLDACVGEQVTVAGVPVPGYENG